MIEGRCGKNVLALIVYYKCTTIFRGLTCNVFLSNPEKPAAQEQTRSPEFCCKVYSVEHINCARGWLRTLICFLPKPFSFKHRTSRHGILPISNKEWMNGHGGIGVTRVILTLAPSLAYFIEYCSKVYHEKMIGGQCGKNRLPLIAHFVCTTIFRDLIFNIFLSNLAKRAAREQTRCPDFFSVKCTLLNLKTAWEVDFAHWYAFCLNPFPSSTEPRGMASFQLATKSGRTDMGE